MKSKTHLRRKFAMVIAILALAHAQMVFACPFTGIAGAHSCCPSKAESHLGHQMGDAEDSAQCQCGQPATADIDGLVKTTNDKSPSQDQKTQWNLPITASLADEGFTLSSRAGPLFKINLVNTHPGTPTYLNTRRLRI